MGHIRCFLLKWSITGLCREELERQQAKENYEKMHLAGKTDEARADLARLALIKKQREEAAKKREDERKGTCNTSVQPLGSSVA